MPRLVVFKSMRGLLFITAPTWTFSISARRVVQDHPAYIPAWLLHFDAARDDQLVATGLDLIRHG